MNFALLLLAVAGRAGAWPACYMSAVPAYALEDHRLAVSYTLMYGSIGGVPLETALLVPGFEDASVRFVLPETWPDAQYNETARTIVAFAGCESRLLTGVVRDSVATRVMISYEGLLQLMGGSVAWSIGAARIMPGTHAWQQFLVRREGTAVASGCAGLDCVFDGRLGDQRVRVIFNPAVAGVGVGVLPPAGGCVALVVHGAREIRIRACSARKVCRDALCGPQLYQHGGSDAATVVLGFDLLEEQQRDLVLYLSETEMRAGFLFSSIWIYYADPIKLAVLVALFLMAAFFVQRPLAVQLDGRPKQRVLVALNMAAATSIAGVMFYYIADIVDNIARSTDLPQAGSILLVVLAVGSVSVELALVAYGNLVLSPASRERTAIVRVAFSSMLAVIFVLLCCGATERDMLMTGAAAGAAIFWLFNMPRILVELYIQFGGVWIVAVGTVLFVVQLPCVALAGLETAIGILNIIDVSPLATTAVFSLYIICGGVFAAIESSNVSPQKEIR